MSHLGVWAAIGLAAAAHAFCDTPSTLSGGTTPRNHLARTTTSEHVGARDASRDAARDAAMADATPAAVAPTEVHASSHECECVANNKPSSLASKDSSEREAIASDVCSRRPLVRFTEGEANGNCTFEGPCVTVLPDADQAEKRVTVIGRLDWSGDLNGDAVVDHILNMGGCGNWGECEFAAYVGCGNGRFALVRDPDYCVGLEVAKTKTHVGAAAWLDLASVTRVSDVKVKTLRERFDGTRYRAAGRPKR